MHWKNLANYDYLGTYSLEGVSEVTLTIKSIRQEIVTSDNGKKEQCIVVSFEETQVGKVIVKPMVMNKTNCKMIEKIYGTGEVESWIGQRITIIPSETRWGRDMVPCLRVKDEKPAPIVYNCSVCGKEITKAVYNGSIAKYGASLCSEECKNKLNEEKGE